MSILKNKKILIGVTASIAAYKIAHLTRLLKKQGAEVQLLMTDASKEFITPLTLSTLSERPVLSDFTKGKTGEWNNHVELGMWADLMLIAPASANTLGKMAGGICDNLLLATYLSARCPVFVCPAMDLDMYAHPSTMRNLVLLQEYGNHIIDAEEGELASGLTGKGRMAEPEHIVAAMEQFLTSEDKPLSGKKVLLTAGPTREYIDPVRYMTNASSGKMGYSLAAAFLKQGADVTIVSGPVDVEAEGGIKIIPVNTAEEMYKATANEFDKVDIAVFTAAVADYTPKYKSDVKIKKEGNDMNIEMVKTHDIAFEMGKLKKSGQMTVGFALETNNEQENAIKKLHKKNLDFVVLNSLQNKGAGFGHDTNQITIFDEQGATTFPLKSKREVAEDIVAYLLKKLQEV
ncbi:bifunctional phosphopantothenoylcysteine decarboxylase/phosphopantothenate--cysteine ligase CoaBC [Limibacter armeniacum]|uniref:bifunctional phosphopantothenoylcysteine decarboxylase/phosphopantothenate--cysteine ligase CoaBC n=1 Tax=Limibacter armeniacum TaxID=466084 RepID=UPI002FE636DE